MAAEVAAAREKRRRGRVRDGRHAPRGVTWRNGRSTPTGSSPALRRGTCASRFTPVVCGAAFQQQGRAAPARRGRGLPAVAGRTSRPIEGTDPDDGRHRGAPRGRRRAVRGPGLQDHDRPVRRAPRVRPRLLRRPGIRRARLQPRAALAGSGSAASSRCTPTSARRSTRSGPATSRRSWACGTSRRATRSATRRTPVILESMDFPEPVIRLAIEPKTKVDQEKLGAGAREARPGGPDVPGEHRSRDRPDDHRRHGRAAPRDPGGPPAAGVRRRGERREARRSRTARPSRPRPRPRASTIRQTGGRGQYGHVKIRIEPTGRDGGFIFENAIVGGAIPKEFIPSIEAGIEEAMEGGVLAGYSMRDVKVVLHDGSYHEVDSSEMAFKTAASIGVQGGLPQGGSRPPRAGDARRGDRPGRLHGRGHRRPQLAPRPDPEPGGPSGSPGDPVGRSARRRSSDTPRTCGP